MDQSFSQLGRPADPCVMVIFGASGDLTKRKLFPALYNLAAANLLPKEFAIVGYAYASGTDDSFRTQLTQDMKELATNPIDQHVWAWFLERIHYVQGDFQDPAGFQRLSAKLTEVEKDHGTQGNRFFYLAVAPKFFAEVVRQLGNAGLASEDKGKYARVVIEKPFGRDLQSAKQLNREIKQVLEEKQIYRIDHYLGKETVQNLLVFRFSNSIAEPLWNRNLIDHVQITAGETVGVEHRGGYYETSGALRDMVPNHLFQLLSLVAMEPPISFEADAVRDKQAEVLRAIQPPAPEDVLTKMVRGQYGPSVRGPQMAGYREEPDVAPDSNVETFVALKFTIDNWRWADVPFYLRTGKRMPKRVTEIAIHFRRTPFVLFRNTPVKDLQANKMLVHIQPREGISIQMGAKIPGPIMNIGQVNMDFDYAREFHSAPATGYERLLHDCMLGDQTLFQRADMVETGWGVIEPIQEVWKALPGHFPNYAAGTWGPDAANVLIGRDGREWRQIEEATAAAA
ncbi:MAG: glucose-6-phosphate dehydrogenase [Terriglobales bacterium]